MVRSALSEAAVCLSPRVLGWDSGCPVARSWGTTGLHAQPVRPHSPEANGGRGNPKFAAKPCRDFAPLRLPGRRRGPLCTRGWRI